MQVPVEAYMRILTESEYLRDQFPGALNAWYYDEIQSS